MKNLLTTIPKSKFPSWELALRVLQKCNGTDDKGRDNYWLINCKTLPKDSGTGAVCYMIYDGLIRGYFDIVDTDKSKNWTRHCASLATRDTHAIIMANWHPLAEPIPYTGFQGYRYTELRP